MMTECIAASCKAEATHVLTIRVLEDVEHGFPEMVTANHYCLDDCLYFAAWLPYVYLDKYELISIEPPASEMFKR